MAKSYRIQRINETIKEIVSELILYKIKDPRVGIVTITAARISRDLSSAKVYFSVMGDEQARTANRSEGHPHQELRVVANAGARRGVGPAEIEDEFALAVSLYVERCGGNQATVLADHQGAGPPSGMAAECAGVFQRRKPVPFEEGRLIARERVPLFPRQLGDAIFELDLGHPPSV